MFQKPENQYLEDSDEKGPSYEQKKWEEEHLNAALLKLSTKDAKSKKKDEDYDYDYDDVEIEFAQALTMPGSKRDKEVRYKLHRISQNYNITQTVFLCCCPD